MGERVRTGEVLTAIGTIALGLLLIFGDWLSAKVLTRTGPAEALAGVDRLGWFFVVLLILTTLAGLVFIAHVLTAKTTERPMLQAPVTFAVALLTSLFVLPRVLAFKPNFGLSSEQIESIRGGLDVSLTTWGWLGVLSMLLVLVGPWVAMRDERSGSAGSIRQTEELLADITVYPAPPADGSAETEAAVVADDAIGTDPVTPARDRPETPGASA